jgi:hypothetical protein
MFYHRDCEPAGRANARPMTGSAKQSRGGKASLDCFVALLLAMTGNAQSGSLQQQRGNAAGAVAHGEHTRPRLAAGARLGYVDAC